MRRDDKTERAWIWDTLKTKPEDQDVVQSVVAKLEQAGAIEACAVQARALVEEGWRRLEPTIDDSLSKMLLRAFGWYVLERHY